MAGIHVKVGCVIAVAAVSMIGVWHSVADSGFAWRPESAVPAPPSSVEFLQATQGSLPERVDIDKYSTPSASEQNVGTQASMSVPASEEFHSVAILEAERQSAHPVARIEASGFVPQCARHGQKRHSQKSVNTKNGAFVLDTCKLVHILDEGLATGLLDIFNGGSILELGAGCGCFSYFWKSHGLKQSSYDGTANIAELTHSLVRTADLRKPLEEDVYDWVLSLEVGEHIPPDSEPQFLLNLHSHAKVGIIVSWAVPGQAGSHHINLRSNQYVIDKMASAGFAFDRQASESLRGKAEYSWFHNTLMVFRKS
eukprot:TRINITY_DN2797_c0_g1_i5.p1 TRINITY_DN2797_c0_g1~~TRINITY_DN2797_c0_g1_i5.p1  ORF type:complete len:327 (-),score=36.04 TRINITY_DN2797_c0_g1_i5:236-1168(-)